MVMLPLNPPSLSAFGCLEKQKKKLHHFSHIRLIRRTLPVSRFLNCQQYLVCLSSLGTQHNYLVRKYESGPNKP